MSSLLKSLEKDYEGAPMGYVHSYALLLLRLLTVLRFDSFIALYQTTAGMLVCKATEINTIPS